MENKEWYYIHDFDDFVENARKLVFKFFGQASEAEKQEEKMLGASLLKLSKEEIEELDTTLTHSESALIVKQIAKKQINKKNKKERYLINDKILNAIIEELNSRMISNILNNLVNRGVLESAYDADVNDFVFWLKEDENKS
jgi:hypothetical protein